jgi:hypothetical protein
MGFSSPQSGSCITAGRDPGCLLLKRLRQKLMLFPLRLYRLQRYHPGTEELNGLPNPGLAGKLKLIPFVQFLHLLRFAAVLILFLYDR